MKILFALYDTDDNFINCGYSLKEIGLSYMQSYLRQHESTNQRLYRIPLEPQNDIFKAEDEAFLKEFKEECYTNKELAEILGISERTLNRRKLKEKLWIYQKS